MTALNPKFDAYSIKNGPHMVDGAMVADIEPPGINCEHFRNNLRFQIAYTDTNSPIGVISVQRCETNIEADFSDITLLAAEIDIVTGDGALATGAIAISGVGAGVIFIRLTNLFGYYRVKYALGSAGTADLMQVRVGAR